jgi:hypothetical protein
MGVYEIRSAGLVEASGVSRQHIYRLRYGLMDPTRQMMVNLRHACETVLRRRVYLSEMFELGEDDVLLHLPPASDYRWDSAGVSAPGRRRAECDLRENVAG